ncbi:hypothetical protein F2Q69_00061893 [Brassica cretica]|uniref:Uncharacterized protein n=1 Tax=Brassica cretica TaxID=69181 RepID=A0A8S9REI5_BRACR|nr:hypothetical protein F2Q69_00061893 [Brassica cretica]
MQQVQQSPFLINTKGLEESSNVMYPSLEVNEGVSHAIPQQESSDYSNQLRYKPLTDMASGVDQTAQARYVKAEENDRGGYGVNNLSRNFLGNINIKAVEENDGYTSWGGSSNISSSWTGFTSNNSTGHLSF